MREQLNTFPSPSPPFSLPRFDSEKESPVGSLRSLLMWKWGIKSSSSSPSFVWSPSSSSRSQRFTSACHDDEHTHIWAYLSPRSVTSNREWKRKSNRQLDIAHLSQFMRHHKFQSITLEKNEKENSENRQMCQTIKKREYKQFCHGMPCNNLFFLFSHLRWSV